MISLGKFPTFLLQRFCYEFSLHFTWFWNWKGCLVFQFSFMVTNVSLLQNSENILICLWIFVKMIIFDSDALAAVQVYNLMYWCFNAVPWLRWCSSINLFEIEGRVVWQSCFFAVLWRLCLGKKNNRFF